MTDNGKQSPKLSNEKFDFMKGLIGNKAALTVMELLSEESKLRYRSFYPVGEMLIGLRYHERKPAADGQKKPTFGRNLKITGGKIVAEERRDVMFVPPLVPHHAEFGYGFWHINDEQEMVLNMKLNEDKMVTVLIEGFPKTGRHDRFAWFCRQCLNPLYMREVETYRVGLPGFYAVEEDAFDVFNNDVDLRTCSECGDVHPHAYSIFPARDTPEERAARSVW